ncbi:MAG TPA: MOSC domain-containing protein [Candidatus Acidoferrum sp.]|nr:MOSC domain-containing protein [Candidatus Acidoferrum sp.]
MVDALRGKVHQLNISKEGIPKTAVRQMYVTPRGAIGDNQGSPISEDAVLSLLPLESYMELARSDKVRVIDRRLQPNLNFKAREGDKPRPGDLGENITTVGLPVMEVKLGDVFQVGSERNGVVFKISSARRAHGAVTEVFGPAWTDILYGAGLRTGLEGSLEWGKGGFEARVLRVGSISAGDSMVRIRSEGNGSEGQRRHWDY